MVFQKAVFCNISKVGIYQVSYETISLETEAPFTEELTSSYDTGNIFLWWLQNLLCNFDELQ